MDRSLDLFSTLFVAVTPFSAYDLCNRSGSLAIMLAILRASSRVGRRQFSARLILEIEKLSVIVAKRPSL
jgi:hypothetical protein